MSAPNYIVLDCSVTLAWILNEGAATKKAESVLYVLEKNIAKVPTIWPLEVANVLCLAERKNKLTALEVAEFKEFLSALPINIDNETSFKAMGSIYTLAKKENLTIYDAAYLEIAIRENYPLATFDQALKNAAKSYDVELVV